MNETIKLTKSTLDITNDINQQIRVARYLLQTSKNVEQFKQAKIDLDNAKAGQLVFTITVLNNNKINYTRN
jgi:hypothetical protein